VFTLSAFADEVADDLAEQMNVLEGEGVKYIELRGVWKKNVLDLTDEEVERVRKETRARGFKISAVGSPIGKIKIDEPFEPHLERFRRAIRIAKALGTGYIRIFSYFLPKGRDPGEFREEVLRRMRAKVELAEKEGVTLLHENERDIYGETGERCLDIHRSVPSKRLRMTFDPANFVQAGEDALACWGKLKDFVVYFHMKDARRDKTVTPVGQGDGQVEAILREAVARGFDGFLSLEPHLMHAGQFSGQTGPQLFKVASDALKALVGRVGGRIRKA